MTLPVSAFVSVWYGMPADGCAYCLVPVHIIAACLRSSFMPDTKRLAPNKQFCDRIERFDFWTIEWNFTCLLPQSALLFCGKDFVCLLTIRLETKVVN